MRNGQHRALRIVHNIATSWRMHAIETMLRHESVRLLPLAKRSQIWVCDLFTDVYLYCMHFAKMWYSRYFQNCMCTVTFYKLIVSCAIIFNVDKPSQIEEFLDYQFELLGVGKSFTKALCQRRSHHQLHPRHRSLSRSTTDTVGRRLEITML